MRSIPRHLVCLFFGAAFATAPQQLTAAIIKADNTSTLNLAGSWSGGVAPTAAEVAEWSGIYNTAGSLSAALGANASWAGIVVGNLSGTAAGTVNVGGTGTPANTLTIGSSGIDMSGANQNLVLNPTFFNVNVSQTWNVATGRNLRIRNASSSADLDGTNAAAVITVAGGGVVDLNQGGAAGFADTAGFANYLGKWQVNAGTTLRGIRNGATAFGTNTSADAIKLNGGTLAVGGISGTQGNWTWQTPITLSSGTSSAIDQQIFSGTGRYLILRGTMTGSGTGTQLTFKETGATDSFDNNNLGYIIAANHSLTSDVTVVIGGATENGITGRLSSVRLGGIATAGSTVTDAGTAGSFGSAAIINNGTLTLSHSDAWTLGNPISGSGNLRIGFVTGSSAQVVTMTGGNSYAGGTAIDSGNTLNINNATALGTGTLTFSGNATFDNTSGLTISLTNNNAILLSGGSPTFTGSNDLSFGTGSVTMSVANRTITVTNSAATLTVGAIGESGGSRNFTKAGAGRLITDGGSYTGTTTVSAGVLVVNGAHANGGAYSVGSGATLAGTGSIGSAVTVTGTVAPGNSIGTLSLSSLTLNGNYLLETNFAGQSDLLAITGIMDLGAGSSLVLSGVLDPAKDYVIANYGSLTGTFATIDPLITATHTIDYVTGNQITLVSMIPEPSTMVLGGIFLLGLSGMAMRRRKRKTQY